MTRRRARSQPATEAPPDIVAASPATSPLPRVDDVHGGSRALAPALVHAQAHAQAQAPAAAPPRSPACSSPLPHQHHDVQRRVAELQHQRYSAIPRLVEALGASNVGTILRAAHEPPTAAWQGPPRDVNAFLPLFGMFFGEFCLGYTINQPSKRAAAAATPAAKAPAAKAPTAKAPAAKAPAANARAPPPVGATPTVPNGNAHAAPTAARATGSKRARSRRATPEAVPEAEPAAVPEAEPVAVAEPATAAASSEADDCQPPAKRCRVRGKSKAPTPPARTTRAASVALKGKQGELPPP
jgi:hypothetical protein